jgi:hypothetical protein
MEIRVEALASHSGYIKVMLVVAIVNEIFRGKG